MAAVTIADRPYTLSYDVPGWSAQPLSSGEARRMLDAYPLVSTAADRVVLQGDGFRMTLTPATLGGGPAFAVTSDHGTNSTDGELDRLVAEIEAAGGSRLGWPASQESGRYAVDFNSGAFADPQLASTGYMPSWQAAMAFAAGILPRLRALEHAARRRPDFDDRGNAPFRAYATVTSERRDPGQGEDGDPVSERDYDPDLPPTPPSPTSATTEEAPPMTTTTTATIGTDAGLGTAGRGCISGLMIDWESSVEARQDPESFIAWLQAQAAAATQRAQMVPELVATYHGRGPSGQAGVPDAQIQAFAQGYEESAQAEADAYGQWAAQYAAYVEEAQEDMTSSYGREVIGAAHAAHQG